MTIPYRTDCHTDAQADDAEDVADTEEEPGEAENRDVIDSATAEKYVYDAADPTGLKTLSIENTRALDGSVFNLIKRNRRKAGAEALKEWKSTLHQLSAEADAAISTNYMMDSMSKKAMKDAQRRLQYFVSLCKNHLRLDSLNGVNTNRRKSNMP